MGVNTLIQIRRGTTTQWSTVNPTLAAGEWGLDTTSGRYKLGDGLTAWNSLKYAAIRPDSNDLAGSGGVGITFATSGVPVTVSVTGIPHDKITDFDDAVSAIIATGVASLDPEAVMDIVGTGLVNGTGIAIDYQDGSDQIAVNVTGISSSLVNDFNTSVSGLLPALTGTNGVSVSALTGNTYTISLSDPTIQVADITDFVDGVNDRVDGLLVGGDNIELTYVDNGDNTSTLTIDATGVALSGHTHTSSDITDFNTSVSGLLPITELSEGTGIGISNVGTDYTISVTGIPSSLVTDFDSSVADVVGTAIVEGTGISLSYDSGADELTVAVSGIPSSLVTDFDSSVTSIMATGVADNVTATANNTANETVYLTFVDGATGSQGIETDTDLTYNPSTNTLSVGVLSTTGNVTIGGDLTVTGTTTTVNSTVVEIGDAVVRVNTSGLSEGGIEIQDGSTNNYKKFVWSNTNSRFEAEGSIQASGFIGDLTGNADTVTNGVYTTDTGTVTSTMILDGTIVNADINASANIDVKKLASGTTGQVLQVSSTGIIWGGLDGGTP